MSNLLNNLLKTLKSSIEKDNLKTLGLYISECMPKFVQKTQINSCNELELLIHPEGVVPVMSFLKENQRTQFHSFMDVTAIDVLTRAFRFEVKFKYFHFQMKY